MPFNILSSQYGLFHRLFNLFGVFLIALYARSALADDISPHTEMLIFALGDSLTAGYGLAPGEGFTDQLEAALISRGYAAKVVNAGVSGDTTTGGLARLDWSLSALPQDPDLVIVELGGNDGLRGVDPAITRKNIDQILQRLKAENIPVLLTGMLAPPNLGEEYEAEFNAIYPEMAQRYDVSLYPFFLEGVAANSALNQADGIHPNSQGVAIIVERITPFIEALIEP